MPYQLKFRRDARNEFRRAARWYENQREGLGERFVDAVQSALDEILKMPTRFGKVYGELRKVRTEVFPYAIFFRIDGQKIRVLAVFHAKRDPLVWQTRADEEQLG